MARWTSDQLKQHNAKKYGKERPLNTNLFTNQVIGYLNQDGFVVWRNNTMGVFDPKKAAQKLLAYVKSVLSRKAKLDIKAISKILNSCYRKHHGRKGIPDIIGYRKSDGKFISVEVKVGKDQLSIEQKYFIQQAQKNNTIAIVARCMNDVLEGIKQE